MHACLFFGPVPSFAVVDGRFRYSDKWDDMDMCDVGNTLGMDTIVKVHIVPLIIHVQQSARFARLDLLPWLALGKDRRRYAGQQSH